MVARGRRGGEEIDSEGESWKKGELKRGGEAHGEGAGRADGVAGEEAAKVDDVEDVGEILAVNLEAGVKALGVVEQSASGGVDLEGRINAAAREIDTTENLRAIFGKDVGGIAVKFEGQPGIVLNAAGKPEARIYLIAEAAANCVALILGVREMAGELSFGGGGVIAEEEPAGDRQPGIAEHIGIAEVT